MKARNSFVAFLVIALFLISGLAYLGSVIEPVKAQLPTQYPLLHVYPEEVVADVGQTFTINVAVYNLTAVSIADPASATALIPLGNLYGFDVQFTWDSSVVKYVSHDVTVPVETFNKPIYPSNYTGSLHREVIQVVNMVNEAGNIPGADPSAKAWFAYAALAPAVAFNGNGVLFNMTFTVLKPGVSPLRLVDSTPGGYYIRLSDIVGNPIGWSWVSQTWLNPLRSGVLRTPGAPTATFKVTPDIGVANKPMSFNASVSGNLSSIKTYMWSFGDGTPPVSSTGPVVEHTYSSPMRTTASLIVVDQNGLSSTNSTLQVTVVASRDLSIGLVNFAGGNVSYPDNITINARASNLGISGITGYSFSENAAVALYYNTSRVDSNTTWVEAETRQVLVSSGSVSDVPFKLNSSTLPVPEAFYQFKLNISGIPPGYEANVTNDEVISPFVFYTFIITHKPSITAFDAGTLLRTDIVKPTIANETATFDVDVLNNGTAADVFRVDIYANDTLVASKNSTLVGRLQSVNVRPTSRLQAGLYVLRAVASSGNATSEYNITLLVILPPQVAIDVVPSSPIFDQNVTISGAGSSSPNQNASIKLYKWDIFRPDTDPTADSPVVTIAASNQSSFIYSFNYSGRWNVVLTVTDSFNITYESDRTSTSAYRRILPVEVGGGGGGLPLELIIGAIVVLAILVALVALYVRRRRRAMRPIIEEEPTEEETSETPSG